jgi:CBS domain-containing protein
MLVEQLMTREVEACRPDSTLAEAAALMWRRDCGVAPVVDEGGRVVGVLTDRDICIALATRGQTAHEVRAAEVMARPVHACTAVDDAEEALALMRRARVRRLPVLDAAGRLAGLLSINDLLRHARRGKGKRRVSRREVLRTLRAIGRPHHLPAESPDEDDDAQDDSRDERHESASKERLGASGETADGPGADARSAEDSRPSL